MAGERRVPNYRKMYPAASEEVITVLRQSERKMQYQEYDLKVERFAVNEEKQKVFFIPGREDSLERMEDEDVQFGDENTNVEEAAITAIMLEKLLVSMKRLTVDEYELIVALFYDGKTEREYAQSKGVYHNAVHKRKILILKKLEKFLEK